MTQKRTFEQPYAEKKYVTVRGHQMAYIDEGEGTPIIFQHGDPASSYLWRNVMPHLEGMGRLIAPDLMGMGDSEKLPPQMGKERYSIDEQCKYFEALIDQLCPNEKVILVIHDCGSMVAFHWANTHRDRVLGIAYMESFVAPLQPTDFPDYVQEQLKHITPEMLEESLQHIPFLFDNLVFKAKEFTETERRYWLKPFENPGEDRRPTISFTMPIKGMCPDWLYEMVDAYSQWMSHNDLPKLLIKAEPGYMIRDRLYDICRQWKNQTEVTVRGEHYIQESTPDEVGQAVAEFVEGVLK